MPFVTDTDPIGLTAPALPQSLLDAREEAEKPGDPSFGEAVSAAFERENLVGSYLSRSKRGWEFDPDYDPVAEVREEGTYADEIGRFTGAGTREDVAAIKSDIDRERENDKTLADAGLTGTLLSMGAAVLDPTIILPGGALYKSTRLGRSVLKSGTSVGAASVGAVAVQELGLQATQELRTGQESIINIAAGGLVGGMLGSALGAYGSRSISKSIRDGVAKTQAVENDLAASMADAVPDNSTVGAAARALDPEASELVRGEVIRKIPGFAQQDPLIRLQLSPFREARESVGRLAETVLETQGAREGKTLMSGPSVETQVKMGEGRIAKASKALDDAYGSYWVDGPVGRVGRFTAPLSASAQRLIGRTSKLTKSEFDVEVGKALREGDEHAIPEVAKAAKAFRKEVFTPYLKEAQDAGILPQDIGVSTAKSYAPRLYVRERIKAERARFVGILQDALKRRRDRAEYGLARDDGGFRAQTSLDELTERRTAAQGRAKAAREEARARRKEAAEGAKTARKAMSEYIRMARNPNRLAPTRINEMVRALGGIRDSALELKTMFDTSAFHFMRRNGRYADGMREALVERGFLPEGSDVNDLFDAMLRDLRDEPVYSRTETSADEFALFEAAKDAARMFDELEVDISRPVAEVLEALNKADPNNTVASALDRLADADDAIARLKEELPRDLADELEEIDKGVNAARLALDDARGRTETLKAISALSDEEIEQITNEATNNILGVDPTRMATLEDFGDGPRGALKERVLNFVKDAEIEEFLEHDVNVLARAYKSTVAPDVALTQMFGDVEMRGAIEAISDAADNAAMNAKSEKDAAKIAAAKEASIRDLMAIRDRIRGTYSIPDNPDAFLWARRIGRQVATWNYVRLLGGMTISAMTDPATIVKSEGFRRTFGEGIVGMASDWKRAKLSMDELQEAGAALDMVMNSRAMSLADLSDPYSPRTRFERASELAGAKFGKAALMAPWNAGMKLFAGVLITNRLLATAAKVAAGDATAKEAASLASAGIDRMMAGRIAEQFARHGDDSGKIKVVGGADWTDAQALEALRGAMLRDVDRAIITPGQDKPLMMSKDLGRLLLQFKSFAFAASQRVFLSGIQQTDGKTLSSVLSGLSLGALVYVVKEKLAGREPRTDWATLGANAFDRSGMTGWLMDVNNVAEKATRGRIGMSAITGEKISRYQSRNIWGTFLGPTADLVSDTFQVSGAAFAGEFGENDLRRGRMMLPGQNLFYLRNLINAAEEGIADAAKLN